MKVYNQEKTQELQEYDLTKGKLIDDTLTINHEEIKAVEKVSHYEIVKEYENGGKDVEEIVDIEAIEGVPSYTETIDVKVYVPFANEELQKIAYRKELLELEMWFKEYDRVSIEHGRCVRMGTPCHHDMAQLDSEAVVKQSRINYIRQNMQE